MLTAEYDARIFSETEKRVVQLGLTLDSLYVGLLDGRWGNASQTGLERFAAKTDRNWTPEGKVRNYHAAAVAAHAIAFIVDHDLGYAEPLARGHRFVAPAGRFVPNPDPAWNTLQLNARDVEIEVLRETAAFTSILHDVFSEDLAPADVPYLVRNPTRLVTSYRKGGWRTYIRSDLVSGGLWATTLVTGPPSADPRVFDVVIGSITLDPGARLHAPRGPLFELVSASVALGRDTDSEPAPTGPEPTRPAPPVAAGSEPKAEIPPAAFAGAGTGFFVNNTDLVTAAHVVEGCARLTLTDGTELAVIALHPQLDLALLASPRRSRSWIPVHLTGKPRLCQRIVVLGYPYFGAYSTALTATGGNVSALTGLRDEPREITISAPVQPGNSGGPLLAVDGTVIGVVIARLDAMRVAEATGSRPENVNYAVTGRELLTFLETEGVSLPRQPAEAVDFDAGIPESHQRAVVPVLCHVR